MGKLDWKRGRFSADWETSEIHRALRGYQNNYGDSVAYYRFDREDSVVNDIYDEGAGVGKVYKTPFDLPVLHVIHQDGPNEDTETGFYYNDDLSLTASFDQLSRIGITQADVLHQNYLKDRLVYDGKVFRVTHMDVMGQIQRLDIVIGINATQVKPDELVNDEQFAKWAALPG